MVKKAAAGSTASAKKVSKGKRRNEKKLNKLNKKRGLPAVEAVEEGEDVANEDAESASGEGADILLGPDATAEESLVLEVLKKEAALEAASGERSFPRKKRSKISKAEQINEAEYLVRTDKSKFRVVDLSSNATSSHLRPATNFREQLLATRSNPRRITSQQLHDRQQKLKWLSARH
uniref:Uncharacterized protein n=1 Tax=Plectus sambesii TaxID=2011161 RepID=A0A914V4T9_9BILA